MTKKDSILVFCAHSDDQIIGPGGTIAKYADEGKAVYTIIFSYGEVGLPWLKRKVAAETRLKEALAANKVIKGKKVFFLGLKEGQITADAEKKNTKKKIEKMIRKHKPSKIFTHSDEDPHLDHRAVCKIVLDVVDSMKYNGDVYAFDVWNPVPIKKSKIPRMYVDIRKYFPRKLNALKCFSSQWISLVELSVSIFFRAFKHGLRSKKWLAERFYKLR